MSDPMDTITDILYATYPRDILSITAFGVNTEREPDDEPRGDEWWEWEIGGVEIKS